ncbi:unnamed protein product [Mytilus edulis]|uniref:HAT C-terminal dimerisation domain-containing protein n=1 Tax=Mytilus edulis TaxID=6550 RepID=A0A8S3R174_MYTED|nr:unnamed protein product [Mytilus edulis]
MAMKTVKAISLMRSDEAYGLFWQKVIQNAERKGVAEPCLPRQKRMPARFETGNAVPEYHDTTQAYFRQIYFEAIDHLVNAIEDRFDTPDFAIYANAEQLLIKCVRGEVFEEEFETVTTFYGDDFHKDNLRTQLQMLSVNFECDGNKGEAVFSDITNFFKALSKGERIWLGEVVKVLQLVLVMPATNATSERSFSSLRRMKTYLRSTMTQSRLNNLMVLNVHKEKTDHLNLVAVAREFVFKENRRNIFGQF